MSDTPASEAERVKAITDAETERVRDEIGRYCSLHTNAAFDRILSSLAALRERERAALDAHNASFSALDQIAKLLNLDDLDDYQDVVNAVAALRDRISAWEEMEAGCVPEGLNFEQYIRALESMNHQQASTIDDHQARIAALTRDAERWRKLVATIEANSGGILLWSMAANEYDAAEASIQALDRENPTKALWFSNGPTLAEAIDAAGMPARAALSAPASPQSGDVEAPGMDESINELITADEAKVTREMCRRCDGCGWYEGGKKFLQTTCEECGGTGIVERLWVAPSETPASEPALEALRLKTLEHHYAQMDKNGYGTPLCECADCVAYRARLTAASPTPEERG